MSNDKISTTFSDEKQDGYASNHGNVSSAQCVVSGALALVLRVSTCAGAAPLAINATEAGWRISVSPLVAIFQRFLITILNLISVAVLVIQFLPDPGRQIRVGESTITVCVWLLDRAMVMIIASLAAYRGPRRMESLITTLKHLQKINANLHSEQCAKTGKMRVLAVCCILTLTVVGPSAELYLQFVDYMEEGGKWWKLVMHGAYYIAYIMGMLALMQFSFTALLVHSAAATLNQRLQRFKLTYPSQVPSTIRHIALSHGEIGEVMRQMNDSDGTIIVAMLVSTFLHLVVTPYYLLLSLTYGEDPLAMVLLQLCWSLLHITTLFLTVEPCQWVESEREATKCLLSQLMVAPRYKQISRELDQFAKQIVLTSSGFMPLGVLTLGRPLTATMLSSVATYLVIIIQFHALGQYKQ